MIRKKCIRPQHGIIYKPGDKYFEINECCCGAPLEVLDDDTSNSECEEISVSNDAVGADNIDERQEANNEKIIVDNDEVVNTKQVIELKKMKCTNCDSGSIYVESEEVYEDGFCPECGYALEIVGSDEKVQGSDKSESEATESIEDKIISEMITEEPHDMGNATFEDDMEQTAYNGYICFSVDSNGFIHFPGEEGYTGEELTEAVSEQDEYENYQGDRIVVYHNKCKYKTIPLKYDETVIGRKCTSSSPDVDLTDIDSERRISRNHVMIYRNNNEYYIRNMSSKNSLHVNSQAILLNEQTKLEDQAKIVLSRFLGMKFYTAVGGDCNE